MSTFIVDPTLHKAIPPSENHAVFSFVFPNAFVRERTQARPRDVGKLAYQLDDSSIWFINKHLPMEWIPIGGRADTIPCPAFEGDNITIEEDTSLTDVLNLICRTIDGLETDLNEIQIELNTPVIIIGYDGEYITVTDGEVQNVYDQVYEIMNDMVGDISDIENRVQSIIDSSNTYTITTTQVPNGTISPNSPTIAHGSDIIFTFRPDSGYEIEYITIDGSQQSITGNTHTITNVTSVMTVSASFSLIPIILDSMDIIPPDTTGFYVGAEYQFQAIGHYSDGTEIDITDQVNWECTSVKAHFSTTVPGLLIIDDVGNFQFTITHDGVSETYTIASEAAVVEYVSIAYPVAPYTAGNTYQFTATATYTDDSTQDITNTCTWSSNNLNVASFETVPRGLLRAKTQGSVVAKCTYNGLIDEFSMIIQEAVISLQDITINVPSGPYYIGSSYQFTSTANFSDGSTQDITSLTTWSDNAGGASFSTLIKGSLVITAAESITVQAEYEGKHDSAVIVSEAAPVTLQTIEVIPPGGPYQVSGSYQFTCEATYTDSSVQNVTSTTTWSITTGSGLANFTSTPGQLTVDGTGIVIVNASYGGLNDTHSITTESEPVTLTSIEISGSNSIEEGASSVYTCAATFSDSTTQPITPVWEIVTGSSFASINSSGTVSAGSVTSDQSVQIRATYGGLIDTHDITIVSVTLDSITISGPTSVDEESTATYTCTAGYSNGSTQTITPTWSANIGTFSGNTYTAPTVSSTTSATITASYQGLTNTHNVTVNNITSVLESITISGSSTVEDNNTLSLTCTASYDDDSTLDITSSAVWDDGGAGGSFSGGIYTPPDVSSNTNVTITATYQGQTDTHSITVNNVEGSTTTLMLGDSWTQINSGLTALTAIEHTEYMSGIITAYNDIHRVRLYGAELYTTTLPSGAFAFGDIAIADNGNLFTISSYPPADPYENFGILQSTDDGLNWNIHHHLSTSGGLGGRIRNFGNGRLIATCTTPGIIGISDDHGETWVNKTFITDYPYCVLDLGSGTLLAGTSSGIYKSTDDGNNWTQMPDVPNDAWIWDIYDFGSGVLFATRLNLGSAGGYKSFDYGNGWTPIYDFTRVSGSRQVNNAVAFVATTGGIYRTVDAGTSWTQTSTMTDIEDFAYFTNNSAGINLVAISRDTIYHSQVDIHSDIYYSTTYNVRPAGGSGVEVFSDAGIDKVESFHISSNGNKFVTVFENSMFKLYQNIQDSGWSQVSGMYTRYVFGREDQVYAIRNNSSSTAIIYKYNSSSDVWDDLGWTGGGQIDIAFVLSDWTPVVGVISGINYDVYYYNGSSWIYLVSTSAAHPIFPLSLNECYRTEPAAGRVIQVWNGSGWTDVHPDLVDCKMIYPYNSKYIVGVEDDLHVSDPGILVYNGDSVTRYDPFSSGDLVDAYGLIVHSPGNIYTASGMGGGLRHFDGNNYFTTGSGAIRLALMDISYVIKYPM